MKIAIIIKSFCETTFSFAEAWASKGHSVDIYYVSAQSQVLKDPGFVTNEIRVPVGGCQELTKRDCCGASQMLRHPSVRLYFYRIPDNWGDLKANPLKGIKDRLDNLRIVACLARKVKEQRYEFVDVIFPSKELNILLYLLSPQNTIVSFHEIITNKNKNNVGWNDLHNSLKIALYRGYNIRLFSNAMKQGVESQLPKAKPFLHVVPFGPFTMYRDYEYKMPISQESLPEDYLLYLGYIYEYKGLDFLWQATELLEEEGKHVNIVVAGNGFVPVIDRMKISKQYTVINRFIDNGEIVEIIKKSKAIVCPYTGGSQSGLPMTVYPFGKPIIATAIGDFPEVVINEKMGFVVPPGDPKALANAISKLYDDKVFYNEMIDNIKNYDDICKEHSWSNIIALYTDMLNNLNISNKSLSYWSLDYLRCSFNSFVFG